MQSVTLTPVGVPQVPSLVVRLYRTRRGLRRASGIPEAIAAFEVPRRRDGTTPVILLSEQDLTFDAIAHEVQHLISWAYGPDLGRKFRRTSREWFVGDKLGEAIAYAAGGIMDAIVSWLEDIGVPVVSEGTEE